MTGRCVLWLRWRWHMLRWRGRDAAWHAIHSYGCTACEDR